MNQSGIIAHDAHGDPTQADTFKKRSPLVKGVNWASL
jgi:hypothetical protein